MRCRLILPFALAVILSGCGMQFGKYTEIGGSFDVLSPGFGVIAIRLGRPFGSSDPIAPYYMLSRFGRE